MSIFFCGDPHGNFEHIVEAVQQHRPAAIVLLGDVQARQPLERELQAIVDLTEVWWIHGNHDTDSDTDHDNLFESALADRNLHGRVVEIAGVRVAGLGGVFRGQIWGPPDAAAYQAPADFLLRCGKGNRWRDGLPRKHRSSIFPAEYQQLMCEQADILVTHAAPSCHPHGFSAIDELARRLGVRQTFHGHHHRDIDYVEHASHLGFMAYGVGFCGVQDQDGRVIQASDFDEHEAPV
ncbi:MAG: metallophosphoesterase [Rhodocyclaceae bacterium]|nr:metallophosphoesterase [Rhodocyclaceae bacterium]